MNTQSLVAASALLLALSGCREDAVSPSGPESEPALATAATTPLAFTQVSGGLNHTCGVTTDNRIYCWGWNRFGTLGVGTNTGPEICMVGDDPCSTRPVAVVGELSFRQVSGGFGFTCGVTTDNQVYCWGQNTEGQLGVGTNTGPETCVGSPGATPSVPCSTRPVAILGGLKFRQLGAGLYHSCGVTTDDRVYCWGSNRYGQLGDSTAVLRRLRPSQVSGAHRFRQVAAGVLHTCAVTTGSRAFCWGNGRDGQLGNGKTYLSFWPRRVAGSGGRRRALLPAAQRGRLPDVREDVCRRGVLLGME
jgi:alpha-tubulin suppressor-like RCC1 family protein